MQAPLPLHGSLEARWTPILKSGLDAKKLSDLLTDFNRAPLLDGLQLNPEIASSLSDQAKSRDLHIQENQALLGASLAYLGAAMSSLLDPSSDQLDRRQLLNLLSRAAQLAAHSYYKQSVARKAFIEPGLDKHIRDVLKDTSSSIFLYGPDLGTKIREATAVAKLGQSLKAQPRPDPKNVRAFPTPRKALGPTRSSQLPKRKSSYKSPGRQSGQKKTRQAPYRRRPQK